MDIEQMKRRIIERLLSNPKNLESLLKHIQMAENSEGVSYGSFEIEISSEIEDNLKNDGMV